MKNYGVAMLNCGELTKQLAKKGTASDVAFYNTRVGDAILCLIEPVNYPEKIQALLHTLNLSDLVVLGVKEVNKEFGECAVAIDALGKKGVLVLHPEADAEQAKKILAPTKLAVFKQLAPDANSVREAILSSEEEKQTGPARLSVDHAFNVKGIGTVVLGVVRGDGPIRVHDQLEMFPTGKKVDVRSIQVQDEDVKEAAPGSRAGLALKGVEAEEIDRGFVFAKPGVLKTSTKVEAEVYLSPFSPTGIKAGDKIHVSLGMQFNPALVEAGELKPGQKSTLTLKMEKPLVTLLQTGLVVKPEAKLRVLGSLEIKA